MSTNLELQLKTDEIMKNHPDWKVQQVIDEMYKQEQWTKSDSNRHDNDGLRSTPKIDTIRKERVYKKEIATDKYGEMSQKNNFNPGNCKSKRIDYTRCYRRQECKHLEACKSLLGGMS